MLHQSSAKLNFFIAKDTSLTKLRRHLSKRSTLPYKSSEDGTNLAFKSGSFMS